MNMKNVVGLIAMGVALFLGGCSTLLSSKVTGKEWVAEATESVQITHDKPQPRVFKSAVRQVYFAKDSTLMVRNSESGKESLIYKAPPGVQLSSISTYADSQYFYVAWRPKMFTNIAEMGRFGDKMVFVARSQDGEAFGAPSRVSSSNGAFSPTITGNGAGDVYVVWQDERNGSAFDLYSNVSHDYANTWKAADVRLDFNAPGETFSAEPALMAEGNNVWLAWTESRKVAGPFSIHIRASNDAGETWSAPQVAATSTSAPFFPRVLLGKDKLYLYWFSDQGVGGAWSDDNGLTWKQFEAGGIASKVRNLLTRVDRQGVIHMVYSTMGEGGKYSNLYYINSANGIDFSPAIRLNSDGAEFSYSAMLANLDFDASNNILATWMDFRFFRPVSMGRFSADQGKTWGPNFLLDRGADVSASQFPVVIANGNEWWVSLMRYQKANLISGQAVLATVDTKNMPDSARFASPSSMEDLRQRATLWWQSRLDKNWSQSYDLLDPLMRAKNKKEGYIRSQGTSVYHAFEVIGAELTDARRARVRVKYTAEVPDVMIGAKLVNIPKKEMETDQEWIFIDGNWFLLFKDIYGNTFLEQ
jgi:hypothetical protein